MTIIIKISPELQVKMKMPAGRRWVSYSQCHLRQLLLGQVQWVVVGTDAKPFGVFASLQTRPHYPVVHDVDERANTVPAFVVEPNLNK